MNLTEKQKAELVRLMVTCVISLLIGIAAIFGYDVAIVQPRDAALAKGISSIVGAPEAGLGARLAGRPAGNLPNGARIGSDSTRIDIWNTGLIQLPAGSAAAPPVGFWADDTAGFYRSATGQVDAVTSLGIGGVAFTGPLKFGKSATYTSGASITHGFAVTPTMCSIFPTQNVTNTLTITATGFSSDMATTANPIYWVCGK